MSTINHSHLRSLAIYATVIECGSFAAAARKLNTSRSRISEQVASLEADLGIRLLQRSTRQLTITPEGEQVYQQVAVLDDILNEVEAVAAPTIPSGRVAITMNHDIAHKHFLPVVAKFQATYPEVQLDLIVDDNRRDLIADQIDLAIRIGFPRDDSLVARVLHEESFALFASPEYIKRFGEPQSLDDLTKAHWITLTQASHTGIQHLRFKDEMVEITPKNDIRCNSPMLLQQLVVQGQGVGMLLPTTVKHERNNHQLVQCMPNLRSEPLIFSLIYPSRRQVPLRTRVLIDYLLNTHLFDS